MTPMRARRSRRRTPATGRLVSSGAFDGVPSTEAKSRVTEWLVGLAAAKPVVNFRLHDWPISRQRYWGPPIPIIYCDDCGAQPVPEDQLPVMLPDVEDFRPDDTGISPLARHEEWYRVRVPEVREPARARDRRVGHVPRQRVVLPALSDADFDDVPFDPELTRKWLPVDLYIGGNEHAVLHLLYSRFITMVLHDMGHLSFDEPFTRFRAHGLIIRDGAKMSKTQGNVVNPDDYIERWGADTFRTYLMFLGPFEQGGDFRDKGISGVRRFLDRLWKSAHDAHDDRLAGHGGDAQAASDHPQGRRRRSRS